MDKAKKAYDPHAALLRRVANRDRKAFVDLFVYYAPRIAIWISRAVADADIGEEIAQEVMLSVWRNAALFDPCKASASTWIFHIARNRKIDRLRHRGRPAAPLEPLPAVILLQTPETLAMAKEEVAHLSAAVESLPPEQAAVVKRLFADGETQDAASEALGVPLGTVKSRLRLALGKMRTFMRGTS